jgi:hypothetical protein
VNLHCQIITAFVEHGHPPNDLDPAALDVLAAHHGVVLHPNSHKIWVAHPFAATPTATWVEEGARGWWAPCLWCALGIAALCAPSATIHTRFGGEREPLVFRADALPDVHVHFPSPARDAWDNVIAWCASVQPFASPADVAPWCARHGMPHGAVVPIAQVAALARVWYGRHLDRDWRKWTIAEAQAHFTSVGLVGEHWRLPMGGDRF